MLRENTVSSGQDKLVRQGRTGRSAQNVAPAFTMKVRPGSG
jgi:hypothetical protein